jgi:hypothetical protein
MEIAAEPAVVAERFMQVFVAGAGLSREGLQFAHRMRLTS